MSAPQDIILSEMGVDTPSSSPANPIVASCVVVSDSITKASLALQGFVREVRESRSELDAISGELHSLDRVLDLLKGDATAVAPKLAGKTTVILDHCAILVKELQRFFVQLGENGGSRLEKKAQWMTTRVHTDNLREALNARKSALGLALDLLSLSHSRDANGKDGTGDHKCSITRAAQDADFQNEMTRIVAELDFLKARARNESLENAATSSLHDYLEGLQCLADIAVLKFDAEQLKRNPALSSIDEAPDSAVEIQHEGLPVEQGIPTLEIDEFLDQLEEMRPPTPPPKALARMSSIRSSTVVTPTLEPPPGLSRSLSTQVSKSSLLARPAVPGRLSSLPSPSTPTHDHPFGGPGQSLYQVTTTISADERSPRSPNKGRIGRFFGHVRNRLSEDNKQNNPLDLTRSSTSSDRSNIVERGSRRLSIALKRAPEPPPEPDVIFGVSLRKSIQVARGTAKTHHAGSGSSKREFPRCILKCCTFIKEEGIETPHVFGEGGDLDAVQKLKTIFSTGPAYGDDISWADFSVYEAADLILLFLSQLPKPLIPSSIAKRWISLSKQATVAGSLSFRLEQCIDFWEEALSGVREPGRSLFKLLLNLWGDIADAAHKNDMTAERLAGRLLKPLMHTPAGSYDTDYMLGLAFLIRKRSEYTLLLQGDTRTSNAAF